MSTLSLRKIKHDSSSVDNITLDSNGRVGVQQASPNVPFEVGGSWRLGTNTSGTYTGGLGGGFNANNNIYSVYCRDRTDTNWNDLWIEAKTLSLKSNGSNTAIYIDQFGRVTKPYQPAFSAYANSGDTVADGNAIPYGGVVFNIGNCYNGSTYRFTAPVSGVYFFIWSNKGTNGQTYYTRLQVNGSAQGSPSEHYANIANPHMHASAFVQMSANDYAWIRSGSNYTRADGADYFSGYLVS
jgi:hypothetical protein